MTTSSPRIHAYFDDGRPFRSRFFSGCTDSVTLPTFPSYFFLLLSNWFFFLFPYLRLRGKVFFSPVTEFCCCGTTYLFRKKKITEFSCRKKGARFFESGSLRRRACFPMHGLPSTCCLCYYTRVQSTPVTVTAPRRVRFQSVRDINRRLVL